MRVRSSLLFATLLIFTFSHGSNAWDPFGIAGSFRDKIEQAGDHLIGKAKQAFEEAMQDLFDKEINPLIDKVNAMILEDADAIKKDVEEVIQQATQEIDAMVDHAAAVAQALIDHEIDEIKQKIIDETAAKVNDCVDHFFQGVNNVLQKFYETVVKVNCMVQGDIDKVYEDVYKLIGNGCLLPDACCRQQGLSFKTLKSMGDSQLYGLEVCRRTSDITEKTPVTELLKAYMDCQIVSKKFYCIDFGTGSARDYFTKEYNAWGVKYDFWNHQNIKKVQQGKGLGFDAPCSSPVDCYQQAIAKLDQARQEIAGKADAAKLQPLLDMQSQQLAIFYGDSCPPGWTESSLTRGFTLVGRPDGGKTGTQLNSPLKAGEKGRVGSHGHAVVDPGHAHSVHDPGHSHQSGMRGGTQGPKGASHDDSGPVDYSIRTSAEATGVSVTGSQTGVTVPVGPASGLDSTDHLPLSYVLVCQKSADLPLMV